MRIRIIENDTRHELCRYRSLINGWWLDMLLGIVIVAAGILAFFYPVESYNIIALLFAIIITISGIIQLYLAYHTPPEYGRGWLIALGAVELLLGILLLSSHSARILALPIFLAFWLIFRSVYIFGTASDMRAYRIRGAGWFIAMAVILIFLAFLILYYPLFGAGAVVALVGISFIFGGIALIIFSIYLLNFKKYLC